MKRGWKLVKVIIRSVCKEVETYVIELVLAYYSFKYLFIF